MKESDATKVVDIDGKKFAIIDASNRYYMILMRTYRDRYIKSKGVFVFPLELWESIEVKVYD